MSKSTNKNTDTKVTEKINCISKKSSTTKKAVKSYQMKYCAIQRMITPTLLNFPFQLQNRHQPLFTCLRAFRKTLRRWNLEDLYSRTRSMSSEWVLLRWDFTWGERKKSHKAKSELPEWHPQNGSVLVSGENPVSCVTLWESCSMLQNSHQSKF